LADIWRSGSGHGQCDRKGVSDAAEGLGPRLNKQQGPNRSQRLATTLKLTRRSEPSRSIRAVAVATWNLTTIKCAWYFG
jgi:hypothetical protein